ncbi:M20/M25/M40 family metallo-hydrolase [Gemmatimonas groenlandica]|uniref:M20/M25/M40 family metallo-hydrolase n=1 Tax=Gemmatimonas groenlandica TaxID=2732249 RepID=A0A6M4IMN0_9BACT|nr:M20/M25/M40 family metallo-hydrolase [Gemmatimonas groenlandica]QJR35345.1 M20/M25/M40 family metallo-hydrolase [Gemmatimonas groenlandica]
MSVFSKRHLYAAAIALGCSVSSVQAQSATSDAATTERLMQRLGALAADSMEGRRAGTPGSVRARAYLVRELTAMGAKPIGSSFVVPVTLRARAGSDTAGANIVARIPGKNSRGPVLVLSAHYDHLGVRNSVVFNGADDDASGCVALLTIAERLLREPPEHDVILAFFDAEESGMVGSKAFVNAPPVALARVAMNINLDMVARQDGKALWVSGTSHTPSLKPIAEQAATNAAVTIRFGHDTKNLKPGDDWTGSSDHSAFHTKGIPFLYLGVEDHDDYHQSGDDADKVDPVFYRGTVEFAYALVRAADAKLNSVTRSRK